MWFYRFLVTTPLLIFLDLDKKTFKSYKFTCNKMYSTIGFLKSGIEIKRLKRKAESLSKQTTEDEDSSSEYSSNCQDEYEDESILKEDIMLFATKNTDEISYLEIHGIDRLQNLNEANKNKIDDKESLDFFIHHDVLITETVISSIYFNTVRKEIDTNYVIMAGFSGEIVAYDALVYNPLLPEFSLKGHTDIINKLLLCNSNNTSKSEMISGGDDNKIIRWDLEQMKMISEENLKRQIKKMALCGINNSESLIVADEKDAYFNGEIFYKSVYEIQCIKVKNNNLFLGDDDGNFGIFDIRNLKAGPVEYKKIHEECLTEFDFYKDKIVTVGQDGKIAMLNDKLEVLKTEKNKNELFCVCVNEEENICVYGGNDEDLKLFNL